MAETSTQSGSMPPKSERRAHPRQRIQSLTYVELGNGNGGIALNVSEGGMTVVAAQPLDAEGTIDIALQLPQTRKRLQVKGDVRWLSDSRKEAGLQFVNLSSEALADIREWMAREASPQPVDETFAPLPTYREPPRRPVEESFFADEDEAQEEVGEAASDAVLELVEAKPIETPDEPVNSPVMDASALETTATKLQRVFEAGHREMEAQAADAETFFLEPLPKEPAKQVVEARASTKTTEAPAAPAVNGGGSRRTPFSTLASESPAARLTEPPRGVDPVPALGAEAESDSRREPAPSRLTSSTAIATSSLAPLDLPRPVFSSSYQPDETAEETGKDIRVHLQSGWVLGLLIVLLAMISFLAGMAVRRGALNRMVGDAEPYGGARPATSLTPGASPSTQNSAAGTNGVSPAPSRQVDIEIVDSANRKWTIAMNPAGTVVPAASTPSETPAQTQPASSATDSAAKPNSQPSSQPQTSAANPPAPPAPSTNNTKTTSNADLSDATTSDNGNGGLLLSLPETPVAASSSIAISVRRLIPIPPEAAAHNRNLQVGSLANVVEPAYPAEAAQQGVEGSVKLRVTFAADGSVQYLDAESGPKALLPNSLTAVRNWRYNPTQLNGKPIETQAEITIVFRLPR
jgi:TonB family protein